MGEYFVEQLMNLGSGNRQSLKVVVAVSDISKINKIQSALSQVNGVSNVQLSSYEGGKGTFSLNYGVHHKHYSIRCKILLTSI